MTSAACKPRRNRHRRRSRAHRRPDPASRHRANAGFIRSLQALGRGLPRRRRLAGPRHGHDRWQRRQRLARGRPGAGAARAGGHGRAGRRRRYAASATVQFLLGPTPDGRPLTKVLTAFRFLPPAGHCATAFLKSRSARGDGNIDRGRGGAAGDGRGGPLPQRAHRPGRGRADRLPGDRSRNLPAGPVAFGRGIRGSSARRGDSKPADRRHTRLGGVPPSPSSLG